MKFSLGREFFLFSQFFIRLPPHEHFWWNFHIFSSSAYDAGNDYISPEETSTRWWWVGRSATTPLKHFFLPLTKLLPYIDSRNTTTRKNGISSEWMRKSAKKHRSISVVSMATDDSLMFNGSTTRAHLPFDSCKTCSLVNCERTSESCPRDSRVEMSKISVQWTEKTRQRRIKDEKSRHELFLVSRLLSSLEFEIKNKHPTDSDSHVYGKFMD